MLDMILAGLSEALQLANLLFVLLGVIAGMIAGAIPGVNGPMAIALCIPLSYYMSPVAAIGFLVGLNKGAFFGGSISGVLLNTPGTPESAATTWDGYPLAKQGKGEKALRMALYASVTGDALRDAGTHPRGRASGGRGPLYGAAGNFRTHLHGHDHHRRAGHPFPAQGLHRSRPRRAARDGGHRARLGSAPPDLRHRPA